VASQGARVNEALETTGTALASAAETGGRAVDESSSRPATLCVRSWVSREMRSARMSPRAIASWSAATGTALASAAETGGRAVDEVLTNRLAALQDAIARGSRRRRGPGP
jgi:hypothetical protein